MLIVEIKGDALEFWAALVVTGVIIILAAYMIKFHNLAVEYQSLYELCREGARYNLTWRGG